jgi:peptide deformylase
VLELGKLSLEYYRPELVNKPCRRVVKLDNLQALTKLVQEMTRLMKQHNETGLAAPQVGIFIQLAIFQIPPYKNVHVLINPEIVNLSGKDLLESESCLSLPPTGEVKARVWRSEIVDVRSGTLQDPDAVQRSIYKAQAARIVQHEIDHLHGVFFIDRCQDVGRGVALRAYSQFLQKTLMREYAEAIR